MTDRTPHPRFAGRDRRGRFLPAESKAAWKLLHPPRCGWRPRYSHWKHCHECGAPFEGLGGRRHLYCSPACAARAHQKRLKTITSTKSKRGLRGLSYQQREILPIVRRPENRDQAQESWWRLPPPGEGIVVPLTGAGIEDRLARLLPPTAPWRWLDLSHALGLGLFPRRGQPARTVLSPDGKPLLLSKAEVLLVDALALGLNVMLLKMRGKRPPRKLTLAQKLRASRPKKQTTQPQSPTAVPVDQAPPTIGSGA